MTQLRASVALPRLEPCALAEVAPVVEANGLEELWIGVPAGARDSSWVVATAGALTAVTSTVRLGLFVSLGASAPPLQVAEDLGVVDQASGGRTELGLVVPPGDTATWEADARSVLRPGRDGACRTARRSP